MPPKSEWWHSIPGVHGQPGGRNRALFSYTYTDTETAAQTTAWEGIFGGKIHSAKLVVPYALRKREPTKNAFLGTKTRIC